MVGIQGSGKTTTTAKLARYLQKKGMKIGNVCADTWRPGAYDQLSQLSEKNQVPFYGEKDNKNSIKIAKNGVEHFKRKIIAPQDIGFKDIYDGAPDSKKELEINLRKAYESFTTKYYPKLYNFTFRMAFPYKGFRLMMKKVTELCNLYNEKNIFRIKPQFDVITFNISIIVKFRLLTFNAQKIFDFQPKFAQDVYNIIYKHRNL